MAGHEGHRLTRQEASELFRSEPHRYIDVGNGEVSYRCVGDGPDVLFSHGWPANSATFRQLLPYLAPHITCHLIDYPGAGDSRFDRSTTLTIEQHVNTLRRVADELGLTAFGVVGHDSGGLIARLAFADDERVTGWALIDTEQPPKPSWRFASFLRLRNIPNFEKILASVANRPRLRRNKFVFGDVFADSSLLSGEFEEFFLAPLRDDLDRQWAAGELIRSFDIELFAQLDEVHARMTAPVQLIWGGSDPFFPIQRTHEMMAGFGGQVDLAVVEAGKLFVHEEFPEPVGAAIQHRFAVGSS